MIVLIAGFKLKYQGVYNRSRTQEQFDDMQAQTLSLNSTEKLTSAFKKEVSDLNLLRE
jgi:hypothetical protein